MTEKPMSNKPPRACVIRVLKMLDFEKQSLSIASKDMIEFRKEDPKFDVNFEYVEMVEITALRDAEKMIEVLESALIEMRASLLCKNCIENHASVNSVLKKLAAWRSRNG